MAKRRKFLAGIGSLAAGSAAAMGTGAFTSVTADRRLTAGVGDDSEALLSIEAMDTTNGDEYAYTYDDSDPGHAETLAFDITQTSNGGNGLNDNATTIIRNVFKVTNLGTQPVYVWAQGLPEGLALFHDDTSYANPGTGQGKNQGAFSDTSNLNVPDDPADVNDPQNPGGYEAAPKITAGENITNIGFIARPSLADGLVDGDFDIVARAASEVE